MRTRRVSLPPASWRHLPNTRWPIAAGAASSGIFARLPAGKTFDTFDFNAVPMVSKAQVMALAAGDGWLDQGANILLFGPPGGGKSHLATAPGIQLNPAGLNESLWRTSRGREGSRQKAQVMALAAGDGWLDAKTPRLDEARQVQRRDT